MGERVFQRGDVRGLFDCLLGSSESLADRVLELAAIPAPTGAEAERARRVRELFAAAGLADVQIDAAGNVLGRAGPAGGAELLVSAHLDCAYAAVPEVRIERVGHWLVGPGVGDNSAGLAALVAVSGALRELERSGGPAPRRPVLFAATVGEEGEGGLRGIKTILDRPEEGIREAISIDGSLGSLVTRGIAVRRYRITVRGPGGHSWADFGRPSATVGIARLAEALSRLRLPRRPRTTLNIGVLRGGTAVNVIPSEAWLDLDLRSESPGELARLERRVLALARRAGRGLDVASRLLDERPWGAMPRGSTLGADAARALAEVGVKGREYAGSTEANIPLSRGVPALAFGVARVEGAHSPDERVDVESLGIGAAALFALLLLRTQSSTFPCMS